MSKLLEFKVWYLYQSGRLTNDERDFMLLCIDKYYFYYVKNIVNAY